MTCLDASGTPLDTAPLELDVSCALEDARFVVDYRVHNIGSESLYLGIVPTSGSGKPRFGDVNRILTAEGELLLDFGPPTVPAGIAVYAKAIPLSHRLEPDDSLEGRLALSVPVQEYHAYSPPVDPTEAGVVEDAMVSRVRVRFWAIPVGVAAFARPVPGYDDLVRAGGGPTLTPECVLELTHDLDVWRRIDEEFWRA